MVFVFVAVILAIVFTFVTHMVKLDLEYKKAKLKAGSGSLPDGVDRSLTVTELEAMIQSAVNDATAPLERRLVQVERRLDEAHVSALPAPKPKTALTGPAMTGIDEPDRSAVVT